MKIYTRTGDDGETGLFGGGRVPKDHHRVEACGSIDELNALLGVVRSGGLEGPVDQLLAEIQRDLFDIGAALATPSVPAKLQEKFPRLGEARVTALEEEIDAFTAPLPPLHCFILPGGSAVGAHIHFARAVCRRTERRLVRLARQEAIAPLPIRYLNRLSDLLFTLGRYVNARVGKTEATWQGLEIEEPRS